jgi:phage terminase large subunit-like protein
MVTCKEIDDYLKYAEEHPKWINKKRKLLIENIVKPTLKRNDVFFDEKTYRNCLQYCKTNYYELFPFQKFIYAFAFMTFRYFQSSSSRKDVEMVKMDLSCRW